MISQITGIINFLLNMSKEDYSNKKHLIIEVNENNKFIDGNVKIEATGTWLKEFCIHKFKSNVWRNVNKKITIHFGNKSVDTYQLYRIDNIVQLELEEPFVKQCDCYLSFVLDISIRVLKSNFSIIKEYLKNEAEKYTNINIKFTGTELFWKEDDKINICTRLIGECITNIITYDSNNFGEKVQNILGVSNKEAIFAEVTTRVFNQLLHCNE